MKGREVGFRRATSIFEQHGGMLRTSYARKAGIPTATLYAMRDAGKTEMVSRGVHRLVDIPPLSDPDLVAVGMRIPCGVICLISALAFHEITTQIPHEVHVALPSGAEEPRLDFPPIRTYRFGGDAYSAGVEKHEIDGVIVRVYSPEKTLADCFKFRNRLGIDTVLEAVRLYAERRQVNTNEILRYAAICRVAGVMRPYLEALIR